MAEDKELFSSAGEEPSVSAHCEVARSNAMVVASLAYHGLASGVVGAFDHLLGWAKTHQVEAFGPLVGVYRDPKSPDDPMLDVEAWLPVDPDMRSSPTQDPAIRIKDIPPALMVQTTFRGFPGEIDSAFARLWDFVRANKLRRSQPLHRQVYVEMPPGCPDESVIEIQLPVEQD